MSSEAGKRGYLLTTQRDVPFVLCFKYPLQKGYTFSELSQKNKNEFQRFLDKVAKMSVQQVNQVYGRKPDKNDTYLENRVYHYAVTETFRIHVIIEEGRYKVIRLDPNHKVHA